MKMIDDDEEKRSILTNIRYYFKYIKYRLQGYSIGVAAFEAERELGLLQSQSIDDEF